jgi:hypothetical protein
VRSRHTPLRIAFRRPWPATRRGRCLWLFSLVFLVIGAINYITTDLPEPSRRALAFALDIAPASVWGWFMVAVGVLSLWSSYCHFGRDRYGFVLLSTFCGTWALGYICGFLFYDAGLRAVAASAIWLLFSGALSLIAGFPNVPMRPPPLVLDEDSER